LDKKNNINWGDWLLTIIMLFAFWPVGLFLLFRQISNIGKPQRSAKRHPYDIKREAEASARAEHAANAAAGNRPSGASPSGTHRTTSAQSKKSPVGKRKKEPKPVSIPGETSGRVLSIVGISVAAVFALALLSTLADSITYGWVNDYISDFFVLSGFFAGGLVCLGVGSHRRRQAKRFRSYLPYIGKNSSVSLSALASAMGKRKRTVYRDLRDMLDLGVLPAGYIDVASDRLILTDAGIPNPPSQDEAESASDTSSEQDENELLIEIRAVNDAIPDQAMSEKIDRIGEITAKILDYQRSHPEKSSQLRSFLNYYLPTTLKVLRAYAQLDAQGIEGENITAAKQRIENMMDQVVYGFEKQLDRLFQDDAMDITSDVEVLENMLRQDGLSGFSFNSAAPSPEQVKDTAKNKSNDQGNGITLSF